MGSPSGRTFTLAELATFNGRDGQPVYVALGGVVYDVSSSDMWSGREHQYAHAGGDDLTGEIGYAPHGEEVLSRFPVVGRLLDEP